MPMVTVSISPEQAARMREAVNCGAYASGSEVVREALIMGGVWRTRYGREVQGTRGSRPGAGERGRSLRCALRTYPPGVRPGYYPTYQGGCNKTFIKASQT